MALSVLSAAYPASAQRTAKGTTTVRVEAGLPGEYAYTRQAMPEWVAFVVGWTMILGLVVAAATVSIGFARYVGYFVEVESPVAAVGLLAAVAGVAVTGIKYSARLTLALSAVQVGGLLLVVAIGAPHVGEVDLLTAPSAGGVLRAAALVFFAFIGFDEVITLAEETRDPTRTVPRALLLCRRACTSRSPSPPSASSVLTRWRPRRARSPTSWRTCWATGEPRWWPRSRS